MSKKEILIKKFPILSHFEGEDIRVQKIDSELLQRIGYDKFWDGSLGMSESSRVYFVILPDEIHRIPYGGFSGSNSAYSQRSEWEGQSIISFLVEKKIMPEEIESIVEDWFKLHDWSGMEYERKKGIVLYLPPTNKSLLSQIFEKAKRKLENISL